MPRVFNTAGPCRTDEHYMIPPTRRLSQVRALVDGQYYFVIHAPRQTGKTTLLRNLSRELTEEGSYAAVTMSLESFVQADVDKSLPRVTEHLRLVATQQLPETLWGGIPEAVSSAPETALYIFLYQWSQQLDRPLVVFFDEVDSLPGAVLISILRQLRDGYTSRPAPFPQSVALGAPRRLTGLRVDEFTRSDSRSAGFQADNEDVLGSEVPFNIVKAHLPLRNFTEEEVCELLMQYTEETGQVFEPDAQREIFYQTQGQPWLVNALASQLTTRYDALVPDRSVAVTRDKVLEAREILIERRDTHLDSLVARLREDRVRRVIELKLADAYKALERGLAQVSAYAKRLGRDVGYLVMFDRKSDVPFEERGEVEEIEQDGVTVVVVRV